MANILVPLAISAAAGFASRLLFPVKGQSTQGSRVDVNDIPASSYGQVIPKVFGLGRVTGQLIWSQPLIETQTTTRNRGGKGGGGNRGSTTNYQYFANFAVLLSEGVMDLYTLYLDGERVWFKGAGVTADILNASNQFERYFRFYRGDNNQNPDSLIQSVEGVANTPAYRNFCYVVFERLPLERYNNRIPTVAAELTSNYAPATTSLRDDGFCDNVNYSTGLRLSYNDGMKRDVSLNLQGAIAGVRLSYISDPDDFNYAPGVLPPDNYGQVEVVHNSPFVQPLSPTPYGLIESGLGLGRKYAYTKDANGLITSATLIPEVSGSVKLLTIKKTDSASPNCINPGTNVFIAECINNYFTGNGTYYLWYRENDDNDGDERRITITGVAPFRIAGTKNAPRTLIKDATGAIVFQTDIGVLFIHSWTPANTPDTGRSAIAPISNSISIVNDGGEAPTRAPNTFPISDIIIDLAIKAGLDPDLIDVTDVENIGIPGFVISSVDAARSAIERLQVAYAFEVYETDGKIFFKKESTVVPNLFIDPNYYVTDVDGESSEFEIKHVNILEMPSEVRVRYVDRHKYFQDGQEYARRDSVAPQNRNIETFEATLSLIAPEARKMAEEILFKALSRSKEFKFRLPFNYLDILPGDVYRISIGSNLQDTIKILKVETGVNFEVTLEAINFDPSSLPDFAQNIPVPSLPLQDNFRRIEEMSAILLDIPIWDNNPNENVVYAAAKGETLAWGGGNLFQRETLADNYFFVDSAGTGAIFGTALNALGYNTDVYPDEYNNVDIELNQGQLVSVTKAAWMGGDNLALIGFEIVAFRNASIIDNRIYRLNGFRRGLFGTDYALKSHQARERFVLLDDHIKSLPDQNSLLNQLRLFKAVSIGEDIEEVNPFSFTNTGNSLDPLSPAHISATRDEVGNIYISWIPRFRRYTYWQDYVNPPADPTFAGFEIEIYKGNELIRIINTSDTQYTYGASLQISDFGAVQSRVSVLISQLSTIVGKGYGRAAIV